MAPQVSIRIALLANWILCAGFAPARLAADESQDELAHLTSEFRAADTDGNGFLSEEEYLKRKGAKNVLQRDFKLFDFNDDGKLSKSEFSVTPGIVHPSLRGPIPDPVEGLRMAAIEALDESFGGWSKTPEMGVHPQNFVIQYIRSISTDNRVRYDSSLIPLADENRNNQVTWPEAVRFIEIELGVRTPSGMLLRETSGRVFAYPSFQYHDANKDGSVSRQEYLDKVKSADAAERFDAGDVDKNGVMTLEETARPRWIGWDDPVLEFRSMDTDFDGLVSREEMKQKTPQYRASLIPATFAAYDDNRDGKMRLDEFRLSPMGNRVCPWWSPIKDTNRDQKILLSEFQYRDFENRLLWRYYFSVFDADADNALSPDEFAFDRIPPQMLHRMSFANHEVSLLYVSEEYAHCGSPSVSPDGTRILFDGWGSGGISTSRIFLMTSEGQNVRNLVSGLMPSWSPDGKRFACSRYDDGSSVWIMNIDGTVEKKIDGGWGAQWSPDGKYIVYTKGRELRFFDVEKNDFRVVLTEKDHPYRYLYYNMGWSPDGSRLAFKAYKADDSICDIASISTGENGPDLKVHLTSDKKPEADLAWLPDGKHLLITMQSPELKRRMPYKLSIAEGSEPELLSGIETDLNYNGVTISPDGKWAVFATSK